MYKQIIIARKDLDMSAGKLSAQVSHASMAFLTTMLRQGAIPYYSLFSNEDNKESHDVKYYEIQFNMEKDLYEKWINGEFTKAVLQAKNKNHLMKAVEMANELGLIENQDYFLIRDNCHTELTPEENGKTLTCIGFKPMDSETIDKIGKKYHLYIG